jgi:hypothetical protein
MTWRLAMSITGWRRPNSFKTKSMNSISRSPSNSWRTYNCTSETTSITRSQQQLQVVEELTPWTR